VSTLGVVVAVGTLLVFDAALPGGLIEGTGAVEYGRSLGFTTLILFQLFHAFNARSDVHSAFRGLFCNRRLRAEAAKFVARRLRPVAARSAALTGYFPSAAAAIRRSIPRKISS
jgi:hypothetical protein